MTIGPPAIPSKHYQGLGNDAQREIVGRVRRRATKRSASAEGLAKTPAGLIRGTQVPGTIRTPILRNLQWHPSCSNASHGARRRDPARAKLKEAIKGRRGGRPIRSESSLSLAGRSNQQTLGQDEEICRR